MRFMKERTLTTVKLALAFFRGKSWVHPLNMINKVQNIKKSSGWLKSHGKDIYEIIFTFQKTGDPKNLMHRIIVKKYRAADFG